MKVHSPAKINLYLHILGKRPDGFHELESLMVPLDFGDELTIDVGGESDAPAISMTCSNPDLPTGDDNLVVRAARLFCETYDIKRDISIHLEKRIPVGAGLGGGSGNAAVVLTALRAIIEPEEVITDDALAELGAQLGSDIPFFIYNLPAVIKGRGEIVEPCQFKRAYTAVLVHPGFGISTPWSYKTYAADPGQGEVGRTFEEDGFTLRNDLERPAFSKHLWLPTVKSWFQVQPEIDDALMSGSGSSMFGILLPEHVADAERVRARFSKEFGEHLFAEVVRFGKKE